MSQDIMKIEPRELIFRDIRLNVASTTSFTIENPLTAAVEFTLRASAPARYDIKPSQIVLAPKQSIVVTVRLFLRTFSGTQQGGHSDSIHIKSHYFDQKIPVQFYMSSRSSQSRSPSPRERAVSGLKASSISNDLVNELNDQIKVKDHRIEELQRIVGNLQSKYPDLERIINARLEEERSVFEEKSHRVLKILRDKDEVVANLKAQLEESTRALQTRTDVSQLESDMHTLAEGKSRDYWTGRAVEPPAGLGMTHRELVNLLEKEKDAHRSCQQSLNEALSTMKDMQSNSSRQQLLGADSVGSGRLQPQDWQELRGLRAQTLDQADQIQTLLAENKRMQKELQEQAALGDQLEQAHKRVSRLNAELAEYQEQYAELKARYVSVEEAKSDLEHTLREKRTECERLQQDLEHSSAAAQRNARSSGSAAPPVGTDSRVNTSRVSWQSDQRRLPGDHHSSSRGHSSQNQQETDRGRDRLASEDSQYVDGARFEESVGGGGLATSTPTQYALHPPETAQQALHEKNALIHLLRDKLQDHEEEIERLNGVVASGDSIQKDLRERLQALDAQLLGRSEEGQVLSARLERLRSEQDAAEHESQAKDIALRSALERAAVKEVASEENSAHLWWAYIWHTMKQQQESAAAGAGASETLDGSAVTGATSIQPGNVDFVPPHETAATVHTARMRDNLRMQAIEIAQLRQELIGKQLTNKLEMDKIREHNEQLQHEVVNLRARSAIRSGDKDIKLAEKDKTIQTLSVRGDMYAQVAAARQEIETEKLTSAHLRADLDQYRLMLEEEQRKVLQNRKEVANLQAQIDSSLVVQSVTNVPGVSPATLLSLMAGKITQLESDAHRSRQECEESTQQLRALQKDMMKIQQQRRQSINSTTATPDYKKIPASAASSPGPRGRSLSPVPTGRRAGISSNPLQRSFSSSNLLAGAGSSRPFAENFTDELNTSLGDEDGLQSPSGSAADWFTGTPGSIAIDGTATPVLVVQSLNRAVLAQRVASQEATIAELSQLVDELKAANMKIEREHLISASATDETDRIEWERSLRKVDLLQTLLDETRSEVKNLQIHNAELEKSLSAVHTSRMVEGTLLRSNMHHQDSENTSVFYEDAPLMGNHTSDMSSYAAADVQYEETQRELQSTKIMLQERTTELKVLMATLESFEIAGVQSSSKFHSEDEYLFNRRPGDHSTAEGSSTNTSAGLESFAYPSAALGARGGAGGGLLSHQGTWGMQALIKRVVELTTELTSQCAEASLEKRRAEDLELRNRSQAKEVNYLKKKLQNSEETTSRASLQLTSVCNQLQEGDRTHIDAISSLRAENDALTTALRESEAALEASEIKVSALTQQAEVADQADFMSWLEFVTLDNQKVATESSHVARQDEEGFSHAHTTDSTRENVVLGSKKLGDSTVRELVESLVLQWKQFVGTVPQMKPLTTPAGGMPKISPTEQRFLKRVTELVLEAHDRANKAEINTYSATARVQQVENANQIAIERLKICASHLNRYRKRCHAFEKVLSVDRKHTGLKQGKLEAMLKKNLSELRSKYNKTVDVLREERRERMINDVKRAMDTQELRKLQAQIAEFEARGTTTLRAREDAITSIEGKMKFSEESMQKWFKIELPRLVSGLPATEDTLSSYYHKENVHPNFDYDSSVPYTQSGSSESAPTAPISTHLMSSLGMDRTYALSQALCSTQAARTAQDQRIAVLTEKVSILKERNLALEGVLVRWKDEIKQSAIAYTTPTVGNNAAHMMQADVQNEHDDGLDQYLSRIPNIPAAGTVQGSVSTMANANRVDAAIHQIHTLTHSEALLTNQVRDLTKQLLEVEEQNIELKGKFEQANARAEEMKGLVDVVMGDEQQLKTKATQQLTRIRLNLEKEHAEELRRIRQSYETEKNCLIGELEAVAKAVEEAKLTSVDTTAWQRMVASAEAGEKSEGFDPHYGTQPHPTPMRTYVRTPPYADHDEQESQEAQEMRRKDSKKRGKGSKRSKKHSRKHRESSTDRSSTTASTSSTDSSEESSSSSSSSCDDTPAAPQSKTSRRHERRSTSRERTRKADRTAGRRTDRADVEEAYHAAAPVGGAAREYAQTLRASAEGLGNREQPAPRTAARPTGRDPMDVRFTPSTNADTSTPSLSLSYINQQQDLAEVQVENLQRQLELERRMHEETKAELAELVSMHQIQKSVFQEHLNRSSTGGGGHDATHSHMQVGTTAGTGGDAGKTLQNRKERGSRKSQSLKEVSKKTADKDFVSLSSFDGSVSVPSLSPPIPEQPAKLPAQPLDQHHRSQQASAPVQQPSLSIFPQPSQRDESYLDISGMGEGPASSLLLDPVSVMINEIQREDPGLWPSLSTLLDELLCVLQGLSERALSLDTRMEARTALAMAARVRVVCTSSATARNLSSSIAAAASKTDFPADKLLRELSKYTENPAAKADSSEEKSMLSANIKARGSLSTSNVEGGEGRDPGSRLHALANRVRMIEADLADDNIPERHMYLMRDLRMRIQEVEKAVSDETAAQQSKWAREREELLRKVSENAELAEQQRRGQSDTMSTMRQRYEDALKNTQESMEQSNQASTQEIERLRDVLSQKEQQIQLQQQLLQQSAAQTMPPPLPVPPVNAVERRASVSQNLTVRAPSPPVPVPTTAAIPTATAPATATADTLNEFLRMQRLVNQSGDQIDQFRQQRQQLEAHYAREVTELKAHFSRYQRAQAEVVRSLEDQLEELHDQNAALQATTEEQQREGAEATGGLGGRLNVNDSLAGGYSLASQVNSLPEAEDVIRKMEFRFRMKSAELDAVLRTMSRMGGSGGGEGDTYGTADHEQTSLDNTLNTFEEADLPPRHHPPTATGAGAGSRYSNNYRGSNMQQQPSNRSSRDTGIGASDFGEGLEHLPRDMQLELYEARMAAADKEVEALHRNLQKERAINASLKTQLQTMQEQAQKLQVRGRTIADAKTIGLRPARAAEEPVLPSMTTAGTSVPFVPAGVASTMDRDRPTSRSQTRRGSTGGILRHSGGDASIPTFSAAPAPSTAPTGPTAAGPADPLLDFTQEYAVPEIPSDSEKMRLLVRRLNELRRSARVEISRLKEQLSTTAATSKPDEGSTVADLRLQILSLKDDNSRKAKLVAELKSAKAAGGTTLEQWKTEAAHLEENTKRLQRAVNSKDAVIKDLKARLEAVEGAVKAAHHEGVAPTTAVLAGLGLDDHASSSKASGIGSPAPVDVSSLSAAELRARLRSSELERARNRTRLQNLKEKVTELETEKRQLEEENAKLRAQGERSEAMRSALVRKDAVLQSLRGEVDKLKTEVEELRTKEQVMHLEFEKKEKQLHRQVETERRSRTDLEQESQLMRQRMVGTTGVATSVELRGPTRSVGEFLSSSGAGSGGNAAGGDLFRSTTSRAQTSSATTTAAGNEGRKSPVPVQRRASTGMSTATPRSNTGLGDMPAPLDSAQDDLRDVMDALGVTPLHLGLGLNPRSSAISSAYTHNTSGRGSTLDRENLASPGEESVSGAPGAGTTAAELSSVERRFKTLVKSSLQSPVRQRRL